MVNCIVCGELLDGKKRKFCSPECDKKHHYQTHKEMYLKRISEWQKRNKERRKGISREWGRRNSKYYKPNKCILCGNDIIRENNYRKKEYCVGCRKNLLKNRAKNRSRAYQETIREVVIKTLGEKCVICDFDRIVEVHHINEKNNERGDWKSYLEEIKKGELLVLLCPTHHRLFHQKLLSNEELEKINIYVRDKYTI